MLRAIPQTNERIEFLRGISGHIRIDIQPVMIINAKLERSSEKEVFFCGYTKE
jgi:hypothetical protein